ncbi:hypothetical protein M1N01_00535 [Thermodesulfovibrionales bacterium]|nr:hypothetical protein [Thermodesulfovibrionales bacterium]
MKSLHKLGIDKIIDRKASRMRNIVIAMIVARIIDPRSKLAMASKVDPMSRLILDLFKLHYAPILRLTSSQAE